MYTVITVGGQAVNLVALPSYPGVRSVEWGVKDSVATVPNIFTGVVQTQSWPGSEMWTGKVTLPPLVQTDAANWIAFLMQLRGMQNAFQLSDPMWQAPLGQPYGSTPVVNNGLSSPLNNGGNPTMSTTLGTSGWQANTSGLLLPADYIQVGYRFYRVLDNVTSDSSGNALINVWPSLRENHANGTAIITGANGGPAPMGLFRLAANERNFSFDITRLTNLSFNFQEWR
jgi:hypothetical protein